MASENNDAMVRIPASKLDALLARVEALEHKTAVQQEQLQNSRAFILDPAYEEWKKEASRPASERTQDIVAKRWTEGKPFQCAFKAVKSDGKPVQLGEYFPLTIRANSPEEAGARYLIAMGVTKSDYQVISTPLAT